MRHLGGEGGGCLNRDSSASVKVPFGRYQKFEADVGVAVFGGRVQGRGLVVVLGVNVGSVAQQQRDEVQLAQAGGENEDRTAILFNVKSKTC